MRISIWWVNSLPSGSWFVNWPTLKQINELVVNSWSHNLCQTCEALSDLKVIILSDLVFADMQHSLLCLTALSRSPTALTALYSVYRCKQENYKISEVIDFAE